MADNERIGGISVDVEGTDSGVEAMLDRLEQRLKTFYDKYGNGAVNVNASTSSSGGGGSSRSARAAEADANTVRFGKGAMGSASGSEYAKLEKAIAAQAAQQKIAFREVAQNVAHPSASTRASAPMVRQQAADTSVDASQITTIVAAVLAAAARNPSALGRLAKAFPKTSDTPATSTSGGAGGIRRARTAADEGEGTAERRLVDRPRGVATEQRGIVHTFDPEVYAEQDRRKEAQSARSRELLASQRGAAGRTSAAEQSLLDSLPGRRRGVRSVRFDTDTPPGGAAEGRKSAATAPLRNGPADPRAIDAANASRLAARAQIASGANETPEQQHAREKAKTDKEPPADKFETPEQAKERTRREREKRQEAKANARAEGAAEDRSVKQDTSFDIRVGKGGFGREVQQAQIQRAQEQAVLSREAEVQAAGRTPHTMASSLSSFFLGPRQEQISAQAGLNAARQQTASATKYLNIFENEMIANEVKATHASSDEAKVLRDKNKAIKDSTQYAGAIRGQSDALDAEGKAAERLGKLSSGFGTAARNLLAVTAGGAAFSVGMQAVGVVTGAVAPVLQNYIDIQTGFGATSTRVTTALGTQTLAMKGNAAEALAAAEAQAGLSTAASDYLNTQLLLPTQIKAGALAMQQASDITRAAYGAGNAPTGLYGGYGGVGGTSLLAQQMGGGMGANETIAQNVAGMRGRGGPDFLGALNQGVSYVTSPDTRSFIGQQSQDQGNVIGNVITEASKLPGAMMESLANMNPFDVAGSASRRQASLAPASGTNAPAPDLQSYLGGLTDAAKRGKAALGDARQASIQYTTSTADVTSAVRAAAAAGDTAGASMASLDHVVMMLDGHVVTTAADWQKASAQIAVGQGIQDPAAMGRLALTQVKQQQLESAASLPGLLQQQAGVNNYGRQAYLNSLNRQQQVAIQTQNPANAAFANIQAPPTAVGTGLVAASAAEQKKITAANVDTQRAQDTLNAYYDQGRKILLDTYHIPAAMVDQMTQVGQTIASTQAAISNESAAYATAQYNFQLFIAKRSLADIAGLTGDAALGQASQLGTMERQNLLLGRQAQMLSFGMSQRQINFSVATAGFAAPGTTAEARAANIAEAKLEANYAQKQLDIQKQMFGNQVKIVDITNLRQGTDLLRQIGLLQQGRQVTIDTSIAQQKLERLQKIQSMLTADAATYITKTNAAISKAESDMYAIEVAAGKAITTLEMQGVLAAYAVGKAYYLGVTGGFLGGGGASPSASTSAPTKTSTGAPTPIGKRTAGGPSLIPTHASGVVGNTSGATNMTVGEAGTETVAVLRNPRNVMGGSMGGGGGVTVNIINPSVRNDGDLYAMKKMILDVLNQKAALQGLRGTVLQ